MEDAILEGQALAADQEEDRHHLADVLDLKEDFEVDEMVVEVEDLDAEADLVKEVEELATIKEGNV